MKMHKQHYDQLRALILAHSTWRDVSPARVASVGATRAIWDCLWRIPHSPRQAWFDANNIYDYLGDSHINTALKNIVEDFER